MEVAGLVGLLEWWKGASRSCGAEAALAALYVELGRTSQLETARFLANQALDLNPGAHEALDLLEGLTPVREREPLCRRYVAFLERAPFHRASPRVREKLIDLYVEHGKYDAALTHVRALTRLTVLSAPSEEVLRACSVALPSQEPFDSGPALHAFERDDDSQDFELDIEVDLDIDVELGAYVEARPRAREQDVAAAE